MPFSHALRLMKPPPLWRQRRPPHLYMRAVCAGIWPAAVCCSSPLLLVAFSLAGTHVARPINLTLMSHSQCELLASDEMLRSVSATAYGKNF